MEKSIVTACLWYDCTVFSIRVVLKYPPCACFSAKLTLHDSEYSYRSIVRAECHLSTDCAASEWYLNAVPAHVAVQAATKQSEHSNHIIVSALL